MLALSVTPVDQDVFGFPSHTAQELRQRRSKGLVMNKGYILLQAPGPQPAGARRRAGICFVAAPRR